MEFKTFDPTKIGFGVVYVEAARQGGKTVLGRDLLFHNKAKFNRAVYAEPGDIATDAYDEQDFPVWCELKDYGEMQSIMDAQKTGGGNVVVIMEHYTAHDSGIGRELYLNGRHRRMLCINSEQAFYPSCAPLKGQVDYEFIRLVMDKQKTWKRAFNIFPTYEEFLDAYNRCTQDYSFMVIDNTVRSDRIEDRVFRYKATYPLPEFTLG